MKYKVKALSVHCDKVRKIFNSGDIIDDTVLHEGQGPELVNSGFLEECPEEEKMIDVTITQEMLDADPTLTENGLSLGDIIQIPEGEEIDKEKELAALETAAKKRNSRKS